MEVGQTTMIFSEPGDSLYRLFKGIPKQDPLFVNPSKSHMTILPGPTVVHHSNQRPCLAVVRDPRAARKHASTFSRETALNMTGCEILRVGGTNSLHSQVGSESQATPG